ncbi:MAG: undecaprenyl-diphosphate phosphatase [Clostridiales bacterium]|jgi:undecaprenyl-diphosphatase|nr:undecaprenyl-diphosphate phosphatase [Clostridiales bacterium]
MTLLEAIILGIIQGLSEFLPISSSGHLALGHLLFGLEEEGLFFTVVIHIGTLIPVVAVFWQDVWVLIKRPFQKMTYLLGVASLPIAVVGLFLRDVVGAAFVSLWALAAGFVVTGVVLLISDKLRKTTKTSEEITYFDALFIGAAQAVAIFPGISRSGSTIAAALARGISREAAVKFAFLMSIPAILGALLIQIIDLVRDYSVAMQDINFLNLGAGMVAAMVSGYFAIKFMLAAVKKAKLRYFAYYVLLLAAAIAVGMVIFN